MSTGNSGVAHRLSPLPTSLNFIIDLLTPSFSSNFYFSFNLWTLEKKTKHILKREKYGERRKIPKIFILLQQYKKISRDKSFNFFFKKLFIYENACTILLFIELRSYTEGDINITLNKIRCVISHHIIGVCNWIFGTSSGGNLCLFPINQFNLFSFHTYIVNGMRYLSSYFWDIDALPSKIRAYMPFTLTEY